MNTMKHIIPFSMMALFATGNDAQAEGIAQYGDGLNQPLSSASKVFVHTKNAGDVIRVHLCRQDSSRNPEPNQPISVKVSDTVISSDMYVSNTALTTLNSAAANISCTDDMTSPLPQTPAVGSTLEFAVPSAGVYSLDLNEGEYVNYARWDISVVPSATPNADVDPTVAAGDIFSYRWNFRTESYDLAAAATGRMYVLVPGGFANTNYVWALDLQEMSGNQYYVNANDLGVQSPYSGMSVEDRDKFGNPIYSTDKYPVYLSYPKGANPNAEPNANPELTDSFRFIDDAAEDSVISPDNDATQETGTFEFTSNVTGTYALTIDLNRDGVFGDEDRLLLGRMSAGVLNQVTWDGKDIHENVVPNAQYDVQLELRIGEYHFVVHDIETSGGGVDDGLTILKALDETTLLGTQVFWDDKTLLKAEYNGTTNLPHGAMSSTATTGAHRHTWGDFSGTSLGNDAYVDTYVYGNSSVFTTQATVAALNNAPVANNATFSVNEKSVPMTRVGQVVANDADGDFLTYQFVSGNVGNAFSLDENSGELTVQGMLDDAVMAQYNLVISVSDHASSVTANVTVDIDNVNQAPVISGAPKTQTSHSQAYLFAPTFSDPEGDALTFSVTNLPSWALFNTANGEITGTPATSDLGIYPNIEISVSDGAETRSLPPFSIEVINNKPQISGVPAATVSHGANYLFAPVFSDLDGDRVFFTAQNLPAWASLNGATGMITGQPLKSDTGFYDNIILTVNDGIDSTSLAPFSITVGNEAPVISGIPVTKIQQDASYFFVPSAMDANNDPLSFMILNKPLWANFDTTSGILSGNPKSQDVGIFKDIVISVTDGSQTVALPNFDIEVENVNDAPVIEGKPELTAVEGEMYRFTPLASDLDKDLLQFEIINKPSWATFNEATGELFGVPSGKDIGTFKGISISVTDEQLTAVLPPFDITVTQQNTPPLIMGKPDTEVAAGKNYWFLPIATDLDKDVLSFTIENMPKWALFDSKNGMLSGMPGDQDIGMYPGIVITVSDGLAQMSLPPFSIVVTAVNKKPIAHPNQVSIAEGGSTLITLTGEDPEKSKLTFEIVDFPTKGTLTGTAPNMTYTAWDGQTGADSFSFVVSDGELLSSIAMVDISLNGDADGDGITDNHDLDDDNDGISDIEEGTQDTDGDGIIDSLDTDSDNDGIEDKDEGTGDADNDGIPDYLDSRLDEDFDGIPDILESRHDSDFDGIPDFLDPDSDNDGLTDGKEAQLTGVDSDEDGIDDLFDVDVTLGTDDNKDGIDDNFELLDSDQDGLINAYDKDSDNDGIPDVVELSLAQNDEDLDGIVDLYDVDFTLGNDEDLDGIDDLFDASVTLGLDANQDGIDDLLIQVNDSDNDSQADYLDTDSDNDGLSDTLEAGLLNQDTDQDGIDDLFDIDTTPGFDDNRDGIVDNIALANSDDDAVVDMHDLDSDNDSIYDVVEAGLNDINNDALLDKGEQVVESAIDSDEDGLADYRDIDSDGDNVFDIETTEFAHLDSDNDGTIDMTLDNDADGIDDSHDNESEQHGNGHLDLDADNDGLANEYEGNLDSDNDGVSQAFDADSDNDGLPDSFETDRPDATGLDSDNDGIDDAYDVDSTGGLDVNADGVDDRFIEVDSDNDGIADYLDTDSDNDGISDTQEQLTVTLSGLDNDGDGIDNAIDVDVTLGQDINADGVDDDAYALTDTDNDGIYDYRDIDSDNDGILDSDENDDYNQDGINDRLQANNTVTTGLTGSGSLTQGLFIMLLGLTLFRRSKLLTSVLVLAGATINLPLQAKAQCEFDSEKGFDQCWYAGAGFGFSKLSPDTKNTAWSISEENDLAYKLYLGMPMTKQSYINLSYEDLGQATLKNANPAQFDDLNIGYDALGLTVGYLLYPQTSKANVFGEIGVAAMSTDKSPYVEQANSTQFTVGVGVQWELFKAWHAKLSISSYDKDAQVLGLSIFKQFGYSQPRKEIKAAPKPQQTVQPVVEKKPSVKTKVKEQAPPKTLPQIAPPVDSDQDGVFDKFDKCANTKQGVTVDKSGCEVFESITLNIQFDSAKFDVKNWYHSDIEKVAQRVTKYPNAQVTVTGHTDSQGNETSNLLLSQQRANAVAQLLAQKSGLTMSEIKVVGLGELEPVEDNATAHGRYLNRRVEITISKK